MSYVKRQELFKNISRTFHELETIIKSGEYRKFIKQQEISQPEPAKADKSKVQASVTKVSKEKTVLLETSPSSSITKAATSIAQIVTKAPDHELMPPPAPAKVNSPPVIASIVTPAHNRTSEAAPEDEDNAIQNLLDDIRGSFERQFDDEFNDFTETAATEGEYILYLLVCYDAAKMILIMFYDRICTCMLLKLWKCKKKQ